MWLGETTRVESVHGDWDNNRGRTVRSGADGKQNNNLGHTIWLKQYY